MPPLTPQELAHFRELAANGGKPLEQPSVEDAVLRDAERSRKMAEVQNLIRQTSNIKKSAMESGLFSTWDKFADPREAERIRLGVQLQAREMDEYKRTKAQLDGKSGPIDIPATEGAGTREHRDFPSFLAKVVTAPLRPAGTFYEKTADNYYARLRSQGMSDEEARKEMWKGTFLETVFANPDASIPAAKDAVKSVVNPSDPTIIRAPANVVRKYGLSQEEQSANPGSVSGDLARAGGATASKLMEISGKPLGFLLEAASGASDMVGALRDKVLNGKDPDAETMARIESSLGKARTDPISVYPQEDPEDLASNRKAPLLPGSMLSPGDAAYVGGALSLIADPTKPALAGGTAVARAGSKAVGAVVPPVAKAVKGAAAGAVDAVEAAAKTRLPGAPKLSERIGDSLQAAKEKAGVYFGGDDARIRYSAQVAKDRGVNSSIDPNAVIHEKNKIQQFQTELLNDTKNAVEKLRNVPPDEVTKFWTIVERGDYSLLKEVSPATGAAALEYVKLATKMGKLGAEDLGYAVRDLYASHGLSEGSIQAVRNAQAKGAIDAPPMPQQAAPKTGSYSRQRTLPETLSEEYGADIKTIPEVNAAVRALDGGTAEALRSRYKIPNMLQKLDDSNFNPELIESNPARNAAKRFVPQANEAAHASFAKNQVEQFAKVLRPDEAVPKGYVELSTPPGQRMNVIERALKNANPNESRIAIPKHMHDMLLQSIEGGPKTGAFWNAWKWATTVGASPAYHFRNMAYSQFKGAPEFGAIDWAKAMKDAAKATAEVKSGRYRAPANAVGKDAVIEQARQLGHFSTETPQQVIGDIRRATDLKPSAIQRVVGKVSNKDTALAADRAIRGTFRAPGKAAQSVDSVNRLAAALAQFERIKNSGSPNAAIEALEFADKFITSTGNKTPFENSLSKVSPFGVWTLRELTSKNGAVAQTLKGKAQAPFIIQEMAEENTDPKNLVNEKFRGRRLRENVGIPTDSRSSTGLPEYLSQPWAMTQVLNPVDPLYRALRGEKAEKVLKSAASEVARQTFPTIGLGLQAASGQNKMSGKPLEMYGKANAIEEVLKRTVPSLAEHVIEIPGKDGAPNEYLSQGYTAALAGAFPYAQYARVMTAKTPQERNRALMMLIGLTKGAADPHLQNVLLTRELFEDTTRAAGTRKKLTKSPR